MGFLGNIGTLALPDWHTLGQGPIFNWVRALVCSDGYEVLGGKDTSEGNPQPSLRMDAVGFWRFRWSVTSGARTIQIDCKQVLNGAPYPTLVVKANASIGVNADVVGTAGTGAGWKTIGPITANPTSAGALWVELRNNMDAQSGMGKCYFDNLVTT
jgi:hypothetical protein